jgi:membrane protein CcdC involved in cytochrome C biogenesis
MPFIQLSPFLTLAAVLAGAAVMIAWRYRETSTPVSAVKIIAPPLGMSAGLSMFFMPAARVPLVWALAAFLAGALLLFYPIARSSRLVRDGEVIRMHRSRAFLWILLGLVAVRIALRSWVENWLSPLQTGGIFFLLAFGMVLRWRISMFLTYRLLVRPQAAATASA